MARNFEKKMVEMALGDWKRVAMATEFDARSAETTKETRKSGRTVKFLVVFIEKSF